MVYILVRKYALIRPDLPDEEKTELLQIVRGFGKFILELWSHKYHVGRFGLRHFAEKEYSIDNGRMELAKGLGEGEQSDRLEGRPIVVAVQPLIVGYGTPDGKNYETGRMVEGSGLGLKETSDWA